MTQIIENVKTMPLWRRVALGLILLGIVFVTGLMVVAWISARQLSNEVVKIYKAGEPTAFPAVKMPQQMTEDANFYYQQALQQIQPGELANFAKINVFYRINLSSLPSSQFPVDLREKVGENLAKMKPVLTNLDRAAGLWLSGFDTGISAGKSLRAERLDSIQSLIFLSSLRTLDLIRAGELDKAADSVITSLKLLRVFDSFPALTLQSRKMISIKLICSDVHLLLQRNAAGNDPNAALPKVRRMTPQRLEKLQSVLEETFPSDTLEKALLAERVLQIEFLRNFLSKDVARKYLSASVPELPERRPLPALTWHRMRVTRALTKLLQDMAWCVKGSRMPWPGPLEHVKDVNQAPSGGKSGIAPIILPVTRLSAETLAAVRGTAALIAIERYRHREKKFPDSLDVLIPAYMKSVPLDPFSGKPMGYSYDAHTCRLFSPLEKADANHLWPVWTDVNSVTPGFNAIPK